MSLGSVRRGQLITTYGVGAIVAVEDESVMVAGLDHWPPEQPGGEELSEPRLHIEGKRLRLPPGEDGFGGIEDDHIPVVRFPWWYYCANCRRLDGYGRMAENGRCRHCDADTLVPSRFIAVCDKHGHLEDFPFWAWVHHGTDEKPDGKHELYLRSEGGSGSLAGIVVDCKTCKLKKSMEGAFDKEALAKVKSCGGRRPWLASNDAGCDGRLRTTQRGASNVWFPIVRSVISIPPWSEGLQTFIGAPQRWELLGADFDEMTLRTMVEKLVAQAKVPFPVDEVLAAVAARKGEQVEKSEDKIREEEFQALCQGREEKSGGNFIAEASKAPPNVASRVDLVSKVSRLREVRAFTGFTRLRPKGEDDEPCPISLDEDWIPAIAVHGEGLFLRLYRPALDEWESMSEAAARAAILRSRWNDSYLNDGRELTARYVLGHTLAHALIDEWSLDGGYPAASLRERIFEVEGEIGLLIYTAAADSAGSLGGLIAQAESARIEASLRNALRRYRWCSSDPVCSETTSQGAEGLNLAACHACALLPETSCEMRNCLLDRALLVGLPTNRELGFFHDLIGD
jgi:hypothetical protein